MTALLTIRRLRKHFKQRALLEIETLTIAPAQAYVLTGANGAGKSTLLRILCGLESAEIAQAEFLG